MISNFPQCRNLLKRKHNAIRNLKDDLVVQWAPTHGLGHVDHSQNIQQERDRLYFQELKKYFLKIQNY